MGDDWITRLEGCLLSRIGSVRLHKVCRLCLGIYPPFMAAVMVIHCITLLLGYNVRLAEYFCQCSLVGVLLWFLISCIFRFCWLQRAFIVYNYAVGFCIDWQRWHGFGGYLFAVRYLMLNVGIILFIEFVRRRAWRDFFNQKLL